MIGHPVVGMDATLGMVRITGFRMVTESMSPLCARKAACVSSAVVQPVPSRIAPYSPTKVLPVFGLIELVNRCTPIRRQTWSRQDDASQDRDDLSEVNRRHGNGAA